MLDILSCLLAEVRGKDGAIFDYQQEGYDFLVERFCWTVAAEGVQSIKKGGRHPSSADLRG